jgi:hypothetical protein
MFTKRAMPDALQNKRPVALHDAWGAYLIKRKRARSFERSISTSQSCFSATNAARHEVAECIARLANAKNVELLRDGICFELAREWSWYTRKSDVLTIAIEGGWYRRTNDELKRFQQLSDELSALFGSLHPITNLLLGCQENLSAALETVATRSAEALSNIPRKTPGEKGRPSCLQSGPGSLSEFTLHLLWDVRDAGGHLTFEKNAGRGTLKQALELLRPHLPPNFIPNAMPLSTLWYIKKLDKDLEGKKLSNSSPVYSDFLSCALGGRV